MAQVGFPLPPSDLLDKLRFHLRSTEQLVTALRNVHGLNITVATFNSKGLPFFVVQKEKSKKS